MTQRRHLVFRFPVGALLVALGLAVLPGLAWGQGLVTNPDVLPIDAVRIQLLNPPADAVRANKLTDDIRKAFGVFPGGRYNRLLINWGANRVRALPGVGAVEVEESPGIDEGLELRLTVTLAEGEAGARAAAPKQGPLVLYSGPDSLLELRATTAAMAYSNGDAWYGQADELLGSNPLANDPAGPGLTGWVEGFASLGIGGIAPVAPNTYVYGSASYLVTGSVGEELFTDKARLHGAVEDAFAGVLYGRTTDNGSRLVATLSAGRQYYSISDGMLLRVTTANGFDRAALQLNPRWANDIAVLAQVRYNNLRVEAFYIDPDEYPPIDTGTLLRGVNIEKVGESPLKYGFSFIDVHRSAYTWVAATPGTPVPQLGARGGLKVIDARFARLPLARDAQGFIVKGELARQWNDSNAFRQRAWGGYGELGYQFGAATWQPVVGYRLSHFTGDDPASATYERWDPLFAGGNGEEWVQGLNHYKLFQDSNVTAHRLQARLRPAPRWELVPQFWVFRAAQENNLGGLISTLGSRDLGKEANLSVKFFGGRQLYAQGHVAVTWPGGGVQSVTVGDLKPWWSAMTFVRYSF
jgi:hypothetical protein